MKVEIHIVADSQDEAAGIFRALAGLPAEPNKALQLAARGFDIIEKLANAEAPLEATPEVKQELAVCPPPTTPARTRRSPAEIKAAKEAEEAAKLKPEEDASTDAAEEAEVEEVEAEEVHTPESLRALAGELLVKDEDNKPKLKALLESFDAPSITKLDAKHYAAFAAKLRKL
jgi:hypothetical protein